MEQPRARRIRIVLSATPFLSLTSVRKAAALAIAELGVGAFFVMGVAQPALQGLTPWFVACAVAVGAYVRAIDIESWALLVPGGLVGRAEAAFGPRAARMAAALTLTERVLLAALVSVVAGQYLVSLVTDVAAAARIGRRLAGQEASVALAVVVVGVLWVRMRIGRDIQRDTFARGAWAGVGLLAVVSGWSVATLAQHPAQLRSLVPAAPIDLSGWRALWALGAFVLVLPAAGGGDGLTRSAHDLPPPRIPALKRASLLVVVFALVAIAVPAFAFALLGPADEPLRWAYTPFAGLIQQLAGPAWLRVLGRMMLALAAILLLVPAAHAALGDARQTLMRLAAADVLPERLASLHPRFGTPAHAIDLAVASTIVVMVASSAQVSWLSRAYAIGLGCALLLKIAVLLWFRRSRPGDGPFRAPLNLRMRGRAIPVGLIGSAAVVGGAVLTTLASGDGPSLTALALAGGLCLLLLTRRGRTEAAPEALDTFELLAPVDLSLGHVEAGPGNVLVPIRNPHSLAHVKRVLGGPGGRDIVVMTVRLVDADSPQDAGAGAAPTALERHVMSQVVAAAEQYRRPVRLLIVPAHNVFDAVVSSAIRLRSSEIVVGESASLSSADQARLLGEAWERAAKPDDFSTRLVIHHRSGRVDVYPLGVHAPALSPADLELIHRVWLDAVKSVGPHVHHHDVVRAALTHMEQQLSGPQRDDALALIRQVARPADELRAVVHARDYSRLRDMVRNRHASDVAALLTELGIEDQVVVFRVLPRKDAAAVFEYLSQEDKETLLKAMAQEDVAALLNSMAPDDRTMFLEELPAAATRQLLALLTPAERSTALALLGYPERSVGRLMTPHYIRVREEWTIHQVLDHVRTHGRDSETLNVIYVVDEQGLLIDDIRIREILLTSPDNLVRDLMDQRFVALKATDDQEAAVAVFRQYDRSALPVTDTAGMLIGIVTIDDVLDVAEAAATREIQKIGGSEALDEPYMDIGFGTMIRKRAGWLTALFLGELLTATAMGAFEAEISRAVVLALFVPLIISSGGNSGSQASTLVIRALALGEVGLGDWWKVMRREVLAGLTLGGILGSIGFLRITLWSTFSDMYGPHWLLIAITVALALVGIVLWGTLIGSLLPFLLRRLGFDPATSSAPFVATLVDVTGLVIYFSVALVVLRGTLL